MILFTSVIDIFQLSVDTMFSSKIHTNITFHISRNFVKKQ